MKTKKTPTIEEVDDKLHEIAYGQPPKRPWPLSVKITVWALGILLAGFAVLYWDATTDYDDGFIDDTNIHRLNRRVPESLGPKQSPAKTVREL